jgi:ADP-ribose pyrophosphatase YjhB (NUDIX family)
MCTYTRLIFESCSWIFTYENQLYFTPTGWLPPSFLLYCHLNPICLAFFEVLMIKEKYRLNLANLTSGKKLRVAQLVKLPLLNGLMKWAIRLVVPRHRVGVVMVVMNEAEQVLMLRHVFHPHTPWGLPGGWLNRQESPGEGVLRELKEETGLTAVLNTIILAGQQHNPPHLGIAYLGQLQGSSLQLSSEIIEAGWFSFDELPGPLLPFHQDAVTAAAAVHRQGAFSRI